MHKMTESTDNKPLKIEVVADSPSPVYADGMHQMALGYPNSRVSFHTVQSSNGTNVETRRVVATVVLPTVTLVEIATQILALVKDSEPQLIAYKDTSGQQLVELLSKISADPSAVAAVAGRPADKPAA